MPSQDELPERLDAVLHVIYLVFNEGYSAISGESLTRDDLSSEAIRFGRLLVQLLPEQEVMGESMAVPFDLLLGRKTYEIFAAHWPFMKDDPGADILNNAKKYVLTISIMR